MMNFVREVCWGVEMTDYRRGRMEEEIWPRQDKEKVFGEIEGKRGQSFTSYLWLLMVAPSIPPSPPPFPISHFPSTAVIVLFLLLFRRQFSHPQNGVAKCEKWRRRKWADFKRERKTFFG
jgi:hypothetical protein